MEKRSPQEQSNTHMGRVLQCRLSSEKPRGQGSWLSLYIFIVGAIAVYYTFR